MSLCVCVWAMLPDSNKMMMISFFLFMLPCALLNGVKVGFFAHSLYYTVVSHCSHTAVAVGRLYVSVFVCVRTITIPSKNDL